MFLKVPVPGAVSALTEQIHLIGAHLPLFRKKRPPHAEGLFRLIHIHLMIHPPEFPGCVHVKPEAAAGPQPPVHPAKGLLQISGPGQIVEGIHRGDRCVHRLDKPQPRHGLMQKQRWRLQVRRLGHGLSEHFFRAVGGSHLITPLGQKTRHCPRAAGQIQHLPDRHAAFAELAHQPVCPLFVSHIRHQGVISGGQSIVAAHFCCSLQRSKSLAYAPVP